MHISLLVLALGLGLTLGNTEITLSFEEGSGTYNVGEDVKLICTITTEEQVALGYNLNWLKKQDGGFNIVGKNKNILSAPFNNEKKYKIDFQYDRKTKINTLTLDIKGVEAVDIGDYKCMVGYDGEEQHNSTELALNITPELASVFSFTTDASSEGSVMLFNVESRVACTADATTRSDQLSLAIRRNGEVDLTPSFRPTTTLSWSGEEGLKMPKIFHRLENRWMPEKAGEGELFCSYQDGDRQLAVQKFKYRRDETATMSCSTNYKVPVKEGDLDVYITCEIFNYSPDVNTLYAKWTFMYEKEDVHLFTGETKHHRSASQVGKKYTLFIPRVTREMITYGKIFNYHLLLSKNVDHEAVVEASFGLPTDTTARVSAATRDYCSATVLLLSSLFLLL